MATAERKSKVVVVEREEDRIVVSMSKDEAYTLARILGKISGPPSGRRGHADSINKALKSVGIHMTDIDPLYFMPKTDLGDLSVQGGITFPDTNGIFPNQR